MCNSRRLFGDLAEWTWGSPGSKWRAFEDLSEWIWGSGRVWRTFGAKWATSGHPDGERVARFPKKSHSRGHPLGLVWQWFPKGSHSCSGERSAYFAHSSNIGTLAEIRRMRATRGNIYSRSERGRRRGWQPGCQSSALPFDIASCADRHAPHPGTCDKSVEHGRADSWPPAGA